MRFGYCEILPRPNEAYRLPIASAFLFTLTMLAVGYVLLGFRGRP